MTATSAKQVFARFPGETLCPTFRAASSGALDAAAARPRLVPAAERAARAPAGALRTLRRACACGSDRTNKLDETYQPKLWRTILVLGLLIAYVIYFIAANDEEVSVKFLFAEARDEPDLGDPAQSLAIGLVARPAPLAALPAEEVRRGRATPSAIRAGDS